MDALTDDDRRVIAAWAADCAERVLPLFEAVAPSDARPRDAIEGARAFVRGDLRRVPLRSIALAAHAAAREVGDPVAAAAARAAGVAGTVPFTHTNPAIIGTTKHVLGAAAYAALARRLATPDDPDAADAELAWAIEHASPEVRAVVRRIPPEAPGRSRVDALVAQLDRALRG